MSIKAIDDFMSWLDCEIEDNTHNEELDDYLMMEAPSHERHVHEGYLRALMVVKGKAEKMGFITPSVRGSGLKSLEG